MGKRKDPAEWTPAYRQRMEKFFQKNPQGTLTEARRGIHSKEVQAEKAKAETSPQAKSEYNLKHKEGNLTLKEKLGKISSEDAAKQKNLLKEMAVNIKKQWEQNIPGTRAYRKTKEEIHEQYLEALEWDLFGGEDDPYDALYYRGEE